MTFQKYFLDVLRYKYLDFEGRASRAEYWYFVMYKWLSIIGLILTSTILSFVPYIGEVISMLFFIAIVGLILPSLAIVVRRLHDVGESGVLLLVGLVPFIGGIVLFVFKVQEGKTGPNKYGPDPYSLEDNYTGPSKALDDFTY